MKKTEIEINQLVKDPDGRVGRVVDVDFNGRVLVIYGDVTFWNASVLEPAEEKNNES